MNLKGATMLFAGGAFALLLVLLLVGSGFSDDTIIASDSGASVSADSGGASSGGDSGGAAGDSEGAAPSGGDSGSSSESGDSGAGDSGAGDSGASEGGESSGSESSESESGSESFESSESSESSESFEASEGSESSESSESSEGSETSESGSESESSESTGEETSEESSESESSESTESEEATEESEETTESEEVTEESTESDSSESEETSEESEETTESEEESSESEESEEETETTEGEQSTSGSSSSTGGSSGSSGGSSDSEEESTDSAETSVSETSEELEAEATDSSEPEAIVEEVAPEETSEVLEAGTADSEFSEETAAEEQQSGEVQDEQVAPEEGATEGEQLVAEEQTAEEELPQLDEIDEELSPVQSEPVCGLEASGTGAANSGFVCGVEEEAVEDDEFGENHNNAVISPPSVLENTEITFTATFTNGGPRKMWKIKADGSSGGWGSVSTSDVGCPTGWTASSPSSSAICEASSSTYWINPGDSVEITFKSESPNVGSSCLDKNWKLTSHFMGGGDDVLTIRSVEVCPPPPYTHTATVLPITVEGGSTATLTFTITNNGPGKMDYIRIQRPSGNPDYVIDEPSIVCPSGWHRVPSSSDQTKAVCEPDHNSDRIPTGSSGVMSFEAEFDSVQSCVSRDSKVKSENDGTKHYESDVSVKFCPPTGTITVVKIVVNDNGGSLDSSQVPLFVDGNSVTNGVQVELDAGTHTVSETNPAGYAQTIGGDCATDGTITLAAGDNKTCTITNDDLPGTLVVIKTVINDNGSSATPEAFSFQVNGGEAVSFEADGQNDLTVNAGTYTVTEPEASGYSTTYDNCAQVQVANGGTATCTITNDDNAPELFARLCSAPTDLCTWDVELPYGSPYAQCNLQYNTYWEPGTPQVPTERTATCTFDGSQFADHTFYFSIDNDVVECTLNGVPIVQNFVHEDCALQDPRDEQQVAISPVAGTNTIICHVRDRGHMTFFDACMVGTTPICADGTPYSTCSATQPLRCDNGTLVNMSSVCGCPEGQVLQGDSCVVPLTIVATKIVCNLESDLPNWGAGGPDITAATASDFLATHPGCRLESGWNFQWGYGAANPGDNTGEALEGWNTFGPTDENGTASATVISEAGTLWAREAWNDGYIPFTGANTNESVSAEIYCAIDVLNYDNYERIDNAASGNTYYCVAFNAPATGTLTVVKHVINDNSGTAGASDFSISVEGSSPDPSQFPGDENGTEVTLGVGQYAVSEQPAEGYETTYSEDCTGSIANGETKRCLVTNDDIPQQSVCEPEVELIQNGGFETPEVTHGTKWDIFDSGTSGLYWSVAWMSPLNTTYGGYTIPEIASLELHEGVIGAAYEGDQYAELDGDWNGHASGPNGEPGSTKITQTIGTAPGEVYTLSFAYSPRQNGAADNLLEVRANGVLLGTESRAGSGSTNWTNHTYTFTADSITTVIEFSDAGTRNSLGTLLDDVSLRCNAPQTGTLTVVKVVVNDNGGTAQVSDFSLYVDDLQVNSGEENKFAPGTHIVSEIQLEGYTSSFSGNCDENGSITLENGDNKTCTITNDDIPQPFSRPCGAQVDLCNWNVTLPLGSQDVSSCNLQYNTEWPINTDATATCTFDGSQYAGHTLYFSVDNDVIECTLNGVPIVQNFLHGGCALQDPRNEQNVSITPVAGTNTIICTVHDYGVQTFFDACVVGEGEPTGSITVIKEVINNDGGTAQVSDFDLYVDQTQVYSGAENEFAPGTYTVSESQMPGYAASFSGDCGASGAMNLSAWDNKTCTITNDDIPPQMTCIDFESLQAGASVEGLGTVDPNINIHSTDPNAPAKVISQGVNPSRYTAPNYNPIKNACLGNPGNYVADGNVSVAGKAFAETDGDSNMGYTFTFAPGVTMDKFSLDMRDFGDWNPYNKNFHEVKMTAYDSGSNVVDQTVLSFDSSTATMPRSSTQFGDLYYTGDACNAATGNTEPGNWNLEVNGAGIVRVELEYTAGLDPNNALDNLCYRRGETVVQNGTLTVYKFVVNNDTGNKTVEDFPLFVDQTQVYSGVSNTFAPGTYSVSEEQQQGYTMVGFSGDCDANGTINLSAGDSKNCTITNDDNPPQDEARLSVRLLEPANPSDVLQNQFFTASANVSCESGNCGDVNVTLDPPVRLLIYNPNSPGPLGGAGCRGDYGVLPYAYLEANGVDVTYWCNSNVIDASVLANYDALYIGRARPAYGYPPSYINSADLRAWVQNGGGVILESNGDNWEPATTNFIWPNIYDMLGYNNCPGIDMSDNAGSGSMSQSMPHPIWDGVSSPVSGYGLYEGELGDYCVGTGTLIGSSSFGAQSPMVNEFGAGRTYSGMLIDYPASGENAEKYFLNIVKWVAGGASKGVIPMGAGYPFYTTSQNPATQSDFPCLAGMAAGSSCIVSWSVNPTGMGTWELFAYANSSSGAANESNRVNVTIISKAKLTVIKEVINDNGGTANVSDFALYVGELRVYSDEENEFEPGTHIVFETQLPGYEATYSGDCDENGSIVLEVGGSKTCTITNDDFVPRLTVYKYVDNYEEGLSPSDFTITVNNSNNTTSFPGSSEGTVLHLEAGGFSVSEEQQEGYYANFSGNCSGIIAENDTLSCTITNYDGAPRLNVTKVVINGNGGTKTVQDFSLFVGETQVSSGDENDFAPGAYVVSETGAEGYTATYSGDCDSQGSITLERYGVKSCTITNDDNVPPTQPTGGPTYGGSSNGGGPLSCEWTCGAWGPDVCPAEGLQTRSCTYRGFCAEGTKPPTEQACVPAPEPEPQPPSNNTNETQQVQQLIGRVPLQIPEPNAGNMTSAPTAAALFGIDLSQWPWLVICPIAIIIAALILWALLKNQKKKGKK